MIIPTTLAVSNIFPTMQFPLVMSCIFHQVFKHYRVWRDVKACEPLEWCQLSEMSGSSSLYLSTVLSKKSLTLLFLFLLNLNVVVLLWDFWFCFQNWSVTLLKCLYQQCLAKRPFSAHFMHTLLALFSFF